MHSATRAFLDKVQQRKKLAVGAGDAECEAMCDLVHGQLLEVFEIERAFDAVERKEDPDTVATLGEYRQKLGALKRELGLLRDQVKKVEQVQRELERVHLRVAPLVRPPEEPTP